MKTTWTKQVRQKVQRVVEAVAEAVSGREVPHACDPSGFRCDCARRKAVNAQSRTRRGGRPLTGRRRDGRAWFDSDREGTR